MSQKLCKMWLNGFSLEPYIDLQFIAWFTEESWKIQIDFYFILFYFINLVCLTIKWFTKLTSQW